MSQVNAAYRQVVYQTATIISATDQLSAAFGAQTRWLRVAIGGFTTALNSGVRYAIGDGTPSTTTAYSVLPANWYEYIAVNPGQKIAFKSNNADITPILSITELC